MQAYNVTLTAPVIFSCIFDCWLAAISHDNHLPKCSLKGVKSHKIAYKRSEIVCGWGVAGE